MFGLHGPELLIILAILIVVFGASRLGGIGGAIGRSIRDFRQAVRNDAAQESPAPSAEPAERTG